MHHAELPATKELFNLPSNSVICNISHTVRCHAKYTHIIETPTAPLGRISTESQGVTGILSPYIVPSMYVSPEGGEKKFIA